jgi:hypothetical protein
LPAPPADALRTRVLSNAEGRRKSGGGVKRLPEVQEKIFLLAQAPKKTRPSPETSTLFIKASE